MTQKEPCPILFEESPEASKKAYKWISRLLSEARGFLVAFPLMLKVMAVLSAMTIPISVTFSTLPTDYLNPWVTWCPSIKSDTDFSVFVDRCFGTNAARIGGPYSIMWYWSMAAIGAFGAFYPHWNFLTGLFVLDLAALIGLKKRFQNKTSLKDSSLLVGYSWISLVYFIANPQFSISTYLIAASIITSKPRWKLAFLIAAPLWRFPVGAPLHVWQFIFSYSLKNPWNYVSYFVMVSLWSLAAYEYLWAKFGDPYRQKHLMMNWIVSTLEPRMKFIIPGLLGSSILAFIFLIMTPYP